MTLQSIFLVCCVFITIYIWGIIVAEEGKGTMEFLIENEYCDMVNKNSIRLCCPPSKTTEPIYIKPIVDDDKMNDQKSIEGYIKNLFFKCIFH